MYHKHSVYDTDLHLIIDPISRNITNTSQKTVLMQNDHNSERFTFEIPRYVEGHDMTLCNVVEIHYINIDASKKNNRSSDIYPVDDIQLSPESDSVVIGSWLVSHNATAFNGSLNFIIRFACVSDENVGDIQYQWFSNVYTGLVVSKGIYNTEVVTNDDDSDVLYAWKKEVYEHIEPLVERAEKAYQEVEELVETSMVLINESVEQAKTSETNAKESETNAKESETNAKESETKAKESEINAKNSENIALTKANESLVNANLSKSYAVGGTGTRDGEDSDNSKFYSEQAGSITSNALDKLKEVGDAIEEFEKKLTNTTFTVNTETGNLEYEDPNHTFTVNEQTGNLEWEVA